MKTNSVISSMVAVCAAAACLFAFAPAASAASVQETVTSTKSFPAYTQVRKDFAAEATSTDVADDASWGDVESLNVPQTKSQAEKDAEAQKKAQEEAAQKAAEQARSQSQSDAAASRNNSRSALSYSDSEATASAGAAASIDRAYSLIGGSMDCTALVTKALAARGINFHGWPEEYVNVPGGYVVTDGSLQPGDILIYKYTNGANGGLHYDHVALYVGGGKAIHGGWNGSNVALAGILASKLTTVVRIP
ncbi:NlpC/P60 family protein [Bifidobacterium cebidarum]|uniref:NLP/P60 protein n=1 Tax=Bifidobacterium cebidarum TaxID=2650773 RepID=A0A6I1GCE0_9BIFI|nr:NlpC/P60 family protein [Bifidobacterium cebidarum]KAB7789245.1 NLP/P60 protein [Bifidobacterium cebidarum]